ncbi:MAG: hypothetical protein ACKVQS_14200 [Fimbriimonadaceae bacterium]
MSYRIECIHGFKLTELEQNRDIVLKSHSYLLAALVFAGGEYVSRESLISLMWADEAEGVARNRLRVSLARFRSMLGSAIVESDGHLSLSRTTVATDVWEIEEMIQSAEDAVSIESELEILVSVVKMLEQNNLAFWGAVSTGLVAKIVKVCRRGIVLAKEIGAHGDLLSFALVGFDLCRDDIQFCLVALEAGIQVNEGSLALNWIRKRASKELLSHPQIVHFSHQIRSGEKPQEKLDGINSQFLIQVFGVALKSRPDICRSILSTPETLPLAGEHPKEMLSLLEQVIVDPVEKNEDWERCVARATGLRAWLNDSPGVLELGYPLIEHSQNPVILRATWNAVSIAHSLMRDWEKATEALNKTQEYARQTGNEIDLLATLGNGASYLMHQMRFEEAEKVYQESLKGLLEIGSPRAMFDHAVGLGNSAFVPVFSGELEDAKIRLEEAIKVRSETSMPVQLGLLQAALGYVEMNLGNRKRVLSLIREGFVDAFRSQSERNIQITFEYAAGALAYAGDVDYARSIFDWVDQWRERSRMPRSLAERALCDRMMNSKGEEIEPIDNGMEPREVGQLLMRKLRMQLQ